MPRLIISLRKVEMFALLLGGLVWLTVLMTFELSESLDPPAFRQLLGWSSVLALGLVAPLGLFGLLARARALGPTGNLLGLLDTATALRESYFDSACDASRRRWCVLCAGILLALCSILSVVLANVLFYFVLY